MSPVKPSDSSRAREVFKCLEPFETKIQPLNLNIVDPKDRTAAGSDDTALAAFAQLGALRLKAQRCMISLLSRDTEYILAESTRTLSLQSDLIHNARDALWLGTTSFASDQGLAVMALDEWRTTRENRHTPPEDDHYYTDGASPHWYLISDLRQHQDLQDRLFVKCGKNLRFYCSVPIRTPTGLVVGSYAVLDDRPRFGISVDEMVFMEDIADTIMGHLSAKRAAMQRQRGDRLIKGLALFTEGRDSLRDWWLETHSRNERGEGQRRRRNSVDDAAARNERADDEFGMTYRADEIPQRGALATTSVRDMAIPASAPEQPQQPSQPKSSALPPSNPEQQQQQQHQQQQQPRVKSGHLSQDTHEGFDLGREIDAAFSRSSNLIREAISAEGVAFIDADFHRSKRSTQNIVTESTTTDPSEGESDPGRAAIKSPGQQRTPGNEGPDAQCALLGFSTKVKSTLRGFAPSAKHSSLPKAFIRSLIRRYPTGKVFNFHDGKALSSSSGTEISDDSLSDNARSNRSRKRRSREFVDAMTLANVFSEPRSVAFLPLWDSRRERWRSAVFVWNNAPNRFLDKAEDVTYLAAFSNSLVAELSRLDAVAADQAKATFISSVSHELRSPLHGVLAGVELLQESDLTTYQQEMATTISLAGTTLLDTINNILDYSKINSFSDVQRKDRTERDLSRNIAFKTADMAEVGVTSSVDLSLLTENVVNTTVTAKSFQASKSKATNAEDEGNNLQSVAVVLNIAKRPNWNLNISPGSWTRVITNLLGNALKYTSSGTVTVDLQVKQMDHTNKSLVSLTIEDTGQGIGSEYLRNHLYTPFMQENTHAVGTGLGLSIVKQIVQDFGGRINFQSELGRGTKVVVSFHAEWDEDAELEIDIPTKSDGGKLKVAFSKTTGKTLRDAINRSVKAAASKTCISWLECESESISAAAYDTGSFDACILSDSEYDNWQEKRMNSKRQPPLIVLGSSSPSSVSQTAAKNAIFINQPFGPRKLSRALAAALASARQSIQKPPCGNPLGISPSPSPLSILTRPRPLPTPQQEKPSVILESPIPSSPSPPLHQSDTIEFAATQKVLLVEDNSINMKILVATMRKLHRQYVCATNGLEAVTAYASAPHTFGLVLMDISMPVMDGYTATETLRALEGKNNWQRCRIMALTGVGDADAKKRAFLSGVDDFLTKPVSIQRMTGIVKELED